jgi:glutamate synthase (NADPH/NADH) small chain
VSEKKAPTAQQMPKLSVEDRTRCFKEVAVGYTEEHATAEAERCIQCKVPRCIEGCPVNIDIPAFIRFIREGRFDEGIKEIKEKNSLPAICGRVCPQESQCMGECVLGIKGTPVNIGALERFLADWERKSGVEKPEVVPSTDKRVAVIGSGPAGLTAAAELGKLGHDVTVFEALHAPGGVLMYGIPEFRMPKDVVMDEVKYVESLGAKIRTDMIIGKAITLGELFNTGFDAVFLGTGAGLPGFLGIPGENLCGIYSANEFLIRVNLMRAYRFPEFDTPIKVGKRTAVIGGGNVAMDAARSALRLGSKVTVIYRRTENEMPARREEVENAKEELINFLFLSTPVKFIGDEQGWVRKIECIRMKLGEPDESGRKRPIPIDGSEFEVEADIVVVAIGQRPNPIAVRNQKGIKLTRYGTIIVDPETYETSIKGVYAAGDIVTGNATVISAMGAAKKAAQAIHKFLTEGN